MKKGIIFIVSILVILFSISVYGNILRDIILKDSNLLNGTINFEENRDNLQNPVFLSDDMQAVVYNAVEMRFYESGLSYIHEIKTNHTGKK